MTSAAVPEAKYAAILGIGPTCSHSEVRFLVVAADTLEELVKRAEAYIAPDRKLCSITIYNLQEPEPRRLFSETISLRGEIERLDKVIQQPLSKY